MPRVIFILLLFATAVSVAQSPFDGTWVNKAGEQLPQSPAVYSLNKETFRCSCAIETIETKPDGYDHKTPGTAYWDTINVQAVDSHTVVVITKKDGRTTFHRNRLSFSGRK